LIGEASRFEKGGEVVVVVVGVGVVVAVVIVVVVVVVVISIIIIIISVCVGVQHQHCRYGFYVSEQGGAIGGRDAFGAGGTAPCFRKCARQTRLTLDRSASFHEKGVGGAAQGRPVEATAPHARWGTPQLFSGCFCCCLIIIIIIIILVAFDGYTIAFG
jgi:hypothetical protein